MFQIKPAESQRVLGRAGARLLTKQELATIVGGRNQTFVFTHVTIDDVTRD